jgi:hypothetical protein
MPAQEAHKDSCLEVHTQPPPPPDYIRGPSTMHGDDAMDIGGTAMEEIILSSPEGGNFHVLNRAEVR